MKRGIESLNLSKNTIKIVNCYGRICEPLKKGGNYIETLSIIKSDDNISMIIIFIIRN